jgi:hypothetical protein
MPKKRAKRPAIKKRIEVDGLSVLWYTQLEGEKDKERASPPINPAPSHSPVAASMEYPRKIARKP